MKFQLDTHKIRFFIKLFSEFKINENEKKKKFKLKFFYRIKLKKEKGFISMNGLEIIEDDCSCLIFPIQFNIGLKLVYEKKEITIFQFFIAKKEFIDRNNFYCLVLLAQSEKCEKYSIFKKEIFEF